MSKTRVNINWVVADPRWGTPKLSAKKIGKEAVVVTLGYIRPLESAEVTVLLANDETLEQLNSQYRKKHKPTNVLSFPAMVAKSGKYLTLGDIAISFERLQIEAKEQKKTFKDHYIHMLVHSTLHLLGHDHENKKDASIMEGLEKLILSSLNIKDPYE